MKNVVDKVLNKVFPQEDGGMRSRGHSFGMQPYVGTINVDKTEVGDNEKAGGNGKAEDGLGSSRPRTVSIGGQCLKIKESK